MPFKYDTLRSGWVCISPVSGTSHLMDSDALYMENSWAFNVNRYTGNLEADGGYVEGELIVDEDEVAENEED